MQKLRAGIAAMGEIISIDGNLPDAPATKPPVAPLPSLFPAPERDPRMAKSTMIEGAVIAFQYAKRPMNVRELFNTMISLGFMYPKGLKSFRGSMTPSLRRKPEFTKGGPGMFQLAAWRDNPPQ